MSPDRGGGPVLSPLLLTFGRKRANRQHRWESPVPYAGGGVAVDVRTAYRAASRESRAGVSESDL